MSNKKIEYNNVNNIIYEKKINGSKYNIINHYKGCFYGCTYCNAKIPFNTVYTDHKWGEVVEVRNSSLEKFEKRISKLNNKNFYLSSLTDPYNPVEKNEKLTQKILKILSQQKIESITIKSKSPLLLRDLKLFKKFDNLNIIIPIFSNNSNIHEILENKSPAKHKRFNTIKKLRKKNIPVSLNIFPYLPEITPVEELIDEFSSFTKNFQLVPPNWKANSIKKSLFDFIRKIEPELLIRYHTIYFKNGEYKSFIEKEAERLKERFKINIKILDN
ncbi:MAG: radical SAM protein [Candidatus Mcinerneyibacterium aminivorans]|uniref:Radical SAM protein n=1 Tax=Candidatus Mcinerneyibacterium aminivorans TaxID=2703815 RepID=A0A5D0MCW7_9BACT|nr:MAG: radical SAM protein [Candidatus Mcinerneyibacterium aminivorans]